MKWFAWALFATVLLGISIPFNKILLDHMGPFFLVATSSFGSVAVVSIFLLNSVRRGTFLNPLKDRKGLPWLGGSLLCGGILGPVLSIIGIDHTSGTVSSLLFNFEIILTVLVAGLLFHEKVGRIAWWAAVAIFAGGLLTTLETGRIELTFLGPALIIISTLLWALDTNFLKQIEKMEHFTIITLQSGIGGLAALGMGFLVAETPPALLPALGGMALGAVCYAGTGVIYLICLKKMGAARTSTIFGVAPFIGAISSIYILNEQWAITIAFGMLFMAIGVTLLLYEKKKQDEEQLFV